MNASSDSIELLNLVYSAAQHARLSAQERRRVQVAFQTLVNRLQSLPVTEIAAEVGFPVHPSEFEAGEVDVLPDSPSEDQEPPSPNSEEVGDLSESPSEDQEDPSPNSEEVI